MRVEALTADTPRPWLAPQKSQGIQCFDHCQSFRIVKCEGYHALTDCILGGFDALRQNLGVRFEDGGFVEFQPLTARSLAPPYAC
jgi:hypothetical protein